MACDNCSAPGGANPSGSAIRAIHCDQFTLLAVERALGGFLARPETKIALAPTGFAGVDLGNKPCGCGLGIG
jgi:hypothetical protein